MIRHICMFTICDENKEYNINEFINRAQNLNKINVIKRLEVVRNCKDAPNSNYDVSLIIDFDSIDDLNKYQVSDIHLEFGKFVKMVRTSRACIDYEF